MPIFPINSLLIRLGLLARKEVLVLTLKGVSCVFCVFFGLLFFIILNLQSFLAITRPLEEADYLVIDGPIPEYAVLEAIKEFEVRNYQFLITTGGPISKGYMVSGLKTYSELVAAAFVNQEFDSSNLIVIPRAQVLKDRTFANATSLKVWFDRSDQLIGTINVFCVGTHARRTRLLYQMALGSSLNVGVISTSNQEYEAHRWWRSSIGFRTVIGESIAYFYARLIFSA